MRIEARIGARLLGLPLLRLDAEILLLPAHASDTESQEAHAGSHAESHVKESHSPPAISTASTARIPRPREVSAPPGSILARAIALAEQSGDSLRRSYEERLDDLR